MNDKKIQRLLKVLNVFEEDVAKTDEVTEVLEVIVEAFKDLSESNSSEHDELRDSLQAINEQVGVDRSSISQALSTNSTSIRDEITQLKRRLESIKLKKGDRGNDADPQEVAAILKSDPEFKQSVTGRVGDKGEAPDITEVASRTVELIESFKGDERIDKSAIKGLEDIEQKVTNITNAPRGGGRSPFAAKNGTNVGPAGIFNFKEGNNISLTVEKVGDSADITINATDADGSGYTTGSIPFAGSSGELTEDNANLFWDDTNNRLGIGTASPLTKLHVEGGSTSLFRMTNSANSGRVSTQFTQDASGGIIQLYNGAETYKVQIAAGDNTFFDGGNVGIGTTNPTNGKLEITQSANAVGLYINKSGTGAGNVATIINAGTGKGLLVDQGVNADWGIRVDTVGLGLKVNSSVNANTLAEFSHTGGNADAVYMTMGSGGAGRLLWLDNNGNGKSLDIDHDGNSASAITGLHVNVANAGAGAAYAAIFEAGNVGIGATTPSAKLHLSGDDNVLRLQGTNSYIEYYTAASVRKSYVQSNDAGTFIVKNEINNGHIELSTTGAGYVGIGTGAPDRKLTIRRTAAVADWVGFMDSSGNTQWHITETNAGDLDFTETGVTNGNLYLKAGGNVGIGTAAPNDARFQIAQGTITTDLNMFRSTATWNAGGVTFTGIKANITDTASASASLLMDLQTASTSRFKVNKTGAVDIANTTGNYYGFGFTGNGFLWDASFGPYLSSTNSFTLNLDSDNNAADTTTFTIRKNSNTTASGTLLFHVGENGQVGVGGITPSYLFDVNGMINTTVFATNTGGYAVAGTRILVADTNNTVLFPRTSSGGIQLNNSANSRANVTVADAGNITILQAVQTSGVPKILTVTPSAHTTLTASTEAIDIDFALNRTVQHATGAITDQRSFIVRAPTHAFVGASVVTNAATLAITGAPIAGTNATLTNAYALWTQAGISRFDGNVGLGVTPTAVLHLKAGTATADTAPLKFTSGTITTVAVAGQVEYNGRFIVTESDAANRFVVQAAASTKTTAGAPFTNDGYITVVINGTAVKLMTTA